MIQVQLLCPRHGVVEVRAVPEGDGVFLTQTCPLMLPFTQPLVPSPNLGSVSFFPRFCGEKLGYRSTVMPTLVRRCANEPGLGNDETGRWLVCERDEDHLGRHRDGNFRWKDDE